MDSHAPPGNKVATGQTVTSGALWAAVTVMVPLSDPLHNLDLVLRKPQVWLSSHLTFLWAVWDPFNKFLFLFNWPEYAFLAYN